MQVDPARLIEARIGRAMSQEEAAIVTDLSARTIQRIEAGHTASLESTKALLTIFGSSIIYDPEVSGSAASVQSPWHMVAVRIGYSARAGFAGLRILFAAVFLLIFMAKPVIPERAGLFVGGDQTTLGVLSRVPDSSSEILGYWIMPLMLLAAIMTLLSIGAVRRFAWQLLHDSRLQ